MVLNNSAALVDIFAAITQAEATFQDEAIKFNKAVKDKNDIKAGTKEATDAEGKDGEKIVIPVSPCPPTLPSGLRDTVFERATFDPANASTGLANAKYNNKSVAKINAANVANAPTGAEEDGNRMGYIAPNPKFEAPVTAYAFDAATSYAKHIQGRLGQGATMVGAPYR